MKIFEKCYDLCLTWAKHKHAEKYLAGLSCSESMFFPIPPDVMLAPMALSQPNKAWRFAAVTTIASVIGGVLGYILGYFAFESLIQPLVIDMGYEAKLAQATQWFEDYGVWVVFLAGFSPIPYKVFTITAGFMHMALLPFIIASTIGRGLRFFLVAALMKYGGPMMEAKLKKYIEIIGWATVVLAVIAYFLIR
ncbi:DedA family protein [Glaciecola sp. MH2013]|uniref:YqaA family protein n=1 Tax=Glaciecola sp. MH2013 TaxID=2785524 RepID=UPI0018A017AC|nr:YqaA family protein [Glaciecola sp. MH2013]MBF7071848.1 DedA family protein [Glaciecola sp. MH2013]